MHADVNVANDGGLISKIILHAPPTHRTIAAKTKSPARGWRLETEVNVFGIMFRVRSSNEFAARSTDIIMGKMQPRPCCVRVYERYEACSKRAHSTRNRLAEGDAGVQPCACVSACA